MHDEILKALEANSKKIVKPIPKVKPEYPKIFEDRYYDYRPPQPISIKLEDSWERQVLRVQCELDVSLLRSSCSEDQLVHEISKQLGYMLWKQLRRNNNDMHM